MLSLAQNSGARRMLNISSGAVYGAFTSQPTGAKEDDELAAITTYGKAKREAEQLCADSPVDFSTARRVCLSRPAPRARRPFRRGEIFCAIAIRGGPILVRGDGTALRSYLHPADLVVWLLRILIRGQRARAYNVGSDEAVTTAQLARKISGAVSPAPEVVVQSVQGTGPAKYLSSLCDTRADGTES